jgi:hypothetical protein
MLDGTPYEVVVVTHDGRMLATAGFPIPAPALGGPRPEGRGDCSPAPQPAFTIESFARWVQRSSCQTIRAVRSSQSGFRRMIDATASFSSIAPQFAGA